MNFSVMANAAAAKTAARRLSTLTHGQKNDALERMAQALEDDSDYLFAANQRDVQSARSLVASGKLKASALDRLPLTPEKLREMTRGLRMIRSLDDPVGKILLHRELDDGLVLQKITFPFGVIAAIVEARPEAVAQLCALCLKSGNSLLIKAGTEASQTAHTLVQMFQEAVTLDSDIPPDIFTSVSGRDAIHELLILPDYIDLIVPRGGSELIRFVLENTKIPVLAHSDGVCHIYVDAYADLEMAIALILDSKIQAPSTCNAVETVLVDRLIAAHFLPRLTEALVSRGVKLCGCEITRQICGDIIEPVQTEHQWHTEYGGLTLALRVIRGCDSAIDHVNLFGSHHTDCIITENTQNRDHFLRDVDSAGVFHNVSTRFSDGYRYGFGAEVGISTGKLHARGPVGLEGLVTYKYLLSGRGQRVCEYIGINARRFSHEEVAS